MLIALRTLTAIQADHFCFVDSGVSYIFGVAWTSWDWSSQGIECGRNRALRASDSRPLSRSLPRLLLFPHHRAAPRADVAEDFLVEQHQKKTLSHWHGGFAGRTEELARLQVFKIFFLVPRYHHNRGPSNLSCLRHNHFAELLAQQQRRKRPDILQACTGCPTTLPFGSP